MRTTYFFFNDTATTEIYTLSLHDALPISIATVATGTPFGIWEMDRSASSPPSGVAAIGTPITGSSVSDARNPGSAAARSEEHTSELQSRLHLVCRLLLEKKKSGAFSVRVS